MSHSISIAGREVGVDRPTFVIAEAGVNHNGDLATAMRMVEVAAQSGADAVKFQTFDSDALATAAAPKAEYQVRTTGGSESQRDMLRRLQLSAAAHRELKSHADRQGIIFLSSPFDDASVDLLLDLGVPAFKIPSGELTNLPLLQRIARSGKPVILSTGMAGLGEIESALRCLLAEGAENVILLQCVTQYPADPADVHLRAMATMKATFGLPVGYSDHTESPEVVLAAVALGACVIEKHFTLDRTLPGPDHRASAEPAELKQLITSIRVVESALGTPRKRPGAGELQNAKVARKSLVARVKIPAGAPFTADNVTTKRPGTGIAPGHLDIVLQRRARVDIEPDQLLSWDMLA